MIRDLSLYRLYSTKQAKECRGFTLAELLVALAILSAITLAMLESYLSAKTAFDHSSSDIAIHHKGREVLAKIVPLIMAAIPGNPNNSSIYDNDAVLTPSIGQTSQTIIFSSTESLLRTDQPCTVHGVPHNTSFEQDILNNTPDTELYKNYRIRYDGNSHTIVLEEVGAAPGNVNTVANPPAPRVLVRSNGDARITNLEFSRQTNGDVKMTVTLQGTRRNAVRSTETVTKIYESVIQIPHYSTKGK